MLEIEEGIEDEAGETNEVEPEQNDEDEDSENNLNSQGEVKFVATFTPAVRDSGNSRYKHT